MSEILPASNHQSGAIITTAGGCTLNPETVDRMRLMHTRLSQFVSSRQRVNAGLGPSPLGIEPSLPRGEFRDGIFWASPTFSGIDAARAHFRQALMASLFGLPVGK